MYMDQCTCDIYFVSLWLIESSEDILEKYRTKPAVSAVVSQEVPLTNIDVTAMKEKRMSVKDEDIHGPPLYDPENLETCFAFTDTKRKLRIVLSNTAYSLGITYWSSPLRWGRRG